MKKNKERKVFITFAPEISEEDNKRRRGQFFDTLLLWQRTKEIIDKETA